jgi:hypothetical protein
MPLPKYLVYNDLSGDEVKHILAQRFDQLVGDVPYLQKHITLPRVKMTLQITLECWADQKYPDTRIINDAVEVRSEGSDAADAILQSVIIGPREVTVDASRHGDPPDKIREEHGLGVPTPTKGKVAVEDVVEGRRVTMPNGTVVDRTGLDPQARSGSTVVHQDFGPAREGRRDMQRIQPPRGPVMPPNWNNKE